MVIYVDNEWKIHDVDSTNNSSLKGYELTDDNFFNGWNTARITCYRVGLEPETIQSENGEIVESGKYRIVMATPYIDSNTVERYSKLEESTNRVDADVADMASTLSDVYMELCEVEMNLM